MHETNLTATTGNFGGTSGNLNIPTNNISWGCCGQPTSNVVTQYLEDENDYTAHHFLLPFLTIDDFTVKLQKNLEGVKAVVVIEVDQEALEDNMFVNEFSKTLYLDKKEYDLDSLLVEYIDQTLSVRIEKREEVQFKDVKVN